MTDEELTYLAGDDITAMTLPWPQVQRLAAELVRAREELRDLVRMRSPDEWHEDIGDVLWWTLPIEEAPWVGSPLASNWPGNYFNAWTPLPDLDARAALGEEPADD